MKAYKITMIVDGGWLDEIANLCSYTESGEICMFKEVSEPFDMDPETLEVMQ